MSAGYSGTPLEKKLGLKAGQAALLIGVPQSVPALADFAHFSRVELVAPEKEARFDYIHIFETRRAALEALAPRLRQLVQPDGVIWISWPKKASKLPTDIAEDVLREVLLPTGLVDVKVCAIDEIWSGLKFVVRRELRGA
ncbi:DUF3052 domain-containing protein [Rhizobium sp. BE258]|jgi:hypothetical protein|uniref:DUF3052 domain-containing protein n=1 Tax=Rhizobium sp. BE258 TaxID=2817722 RepID=UPI000DD64054|nr:DUF3052 domain-containing protein [Rhizobium sp. BE258]MDR7144361.1 hypothetical protein [Rhizobium sp. BE258]